MGSGAAATLPLQAFNFIEALCGCLGIQSWFKLEAQLFNTLRMLGLNIHHRSMSAIETFVSKSP